MQFQYYLVLDWNIVFIVTKERLSQMLVCFKIAIIITKSTLESI